MKDQSNSFIGSFRRLFERLSGFTAKTVKLFVALMTALSVVSMMPESSVFAAAHINRMDYFYNNYPTRKITGSAATELNKKSWKDGETITGSGTITNFENRSGQNGGHSIFDFAFKTGKLAPLDSKPGYNYWCVTWGAADPNRGDKYDYRATVDVNGNTITVTIHAKKPGEPWQSRSDAGKVASGVSYQQLMGRFSWTKIDDYGKVEVVKKDADTNKEVKGGKFELVNNETITKKDGSTAKAGKYKRNLTGGGDAISVPIGKYTITEVSPPDGYELPDDEDKTVTVKSNDTATVTFKDEKESNPTYVYVKKTSADGKTEIDGATFTIVNTEEITIQKQGKQDEKREKGKYKKTISGNSRISVPVGKYEVTEKDSPDGYVASSDSQEVEVKSSNGYTTDKDGKKTYHPATVTFSDYQMTANKIDKDTQQPLVGALLQVLDGSDNVVDEWWTDGAAHTIQNLDDGQGYKLHEAQAPDGYQTAEDVSFIASADNPAVTMEDEQNKININVMKRDALNQYFVKRSNFKFQLIQDSPDGKVIGEQTTNGDGVASFTNLAIGHNYYVRETENDSHYLPKGEAVLAVDAGITTSVPNGYTIGFQFDNNPALGTATLKKRYQTEDGLYGDTTLVGAKYTLYAAEDIQSPYDPNVILWHSGEVISSKDGYGDTGEKATEGDAKTTEATVSWGNLPLGKYYAKETGAPTGMMTDGNTYSFTVSHNSPDASAAVSPNENTSREESKRRKLRIYKMKRGDAKIGINGAEFTVKLKSEVDEKGWDAAKTYAVGTTANNEDGEPGYCTLSEADGKGLPYGEYLIRETKSPEEYWPADDVTVSITKDSSEYHEPVEVAVKSVTIEDENVSAYLKIVKQDKDRQVPVTADGASFKIYKDTNRNGVKDNDEEYVTMSNGMLARYDTFTTRSDGAIIPAAGNYAGTAATGDEKGSVVTPVRLDAGFYGITEITPPAGYTVLSQDIPFEISKRTVTKESGKEPVITVTATNEQPKGELTITKSINLWKGANYSRFDKNHNGKIDAGEVDYPSIRFTMKADEDIYDHTDNTKMYSKGDTVYFKDGKVVPKDTEGAQDYIALDKDGKAKVGRIWMGAYKVTETATLKGLVTNTKVYDEVFTMTDNRKTIYEKSEDVENDTTKVIIHKTDADGKNELEGAKFRVVDSEGKTVDEWYTTKTPYKMEGLTAGEKYTLEELEAPDGYVKAKPVEFTVKDTAEEQTVTMKDKQVKITKTDTAGKNISGAELTVWEDTNSDGKMQKKEIRDEWTSTDQTHIVNGLEEGHSYILTEVTAPDGYVRSVDKKFDAEGADEKGEKKNQEITLQDKTVGVTKTDVTGEKEVPGAKLTVWEDRNGDKIRQDDEIVDEWTSTADEHLIAGLQEGHTYTLDETTAPKGYVKSKSIEFKVSEEKKNEKIVMKDKTVAITKKDAAGSNEVEGAQLTVTDKDGKIVDSWTSGKEAHYVTNLEEGETYTLSENTAPDGYVKAESIQFTVSEEKENQEVTMKDEKVTSKKTDATTGAMLGGAKLAVWEDRNGDKTRQNDEIVDQWTTEAGKTHDIKGLEEGHAYILTEIQAPKGYVRAKDIEFTADKAGEDGSKADKVVEMIDRVFEITKTDVTGKQEIPGAVLTVTDKEGKVVDTWTSTKAAHKVSGLLEGETYTLTETTAPNGYVKAEKIVFTVEAKEAIQKCLMKDKSVSVTKTDITGKKEIVGAKLAVTDEKGKTVDSWISDKTAHKVSGLEEGKKYTLTEITAPDGYVKAEKITFTVTGDKVNQKVAMKDKTVSVTKTDVTGKKEVIGAKLTVRDEKGKAVDSWTSGKKAHKVSGLEEGKKYTLTEVTSPDGYVKAESITFTVSKNKVDQKVTMKDAVVTVTKTDITGKKEVPGAKLTVRDSANRTIDSWISGRTPHKVKGLETGRKYILTEVTAPKGYKKAESIRFTVTGKKNLNVIMKDEKIKPVKPVHHKPAPKPRKKVKKAKKAKKVTRSRPTKTGDNTSIMPYVLAAVLSLSMILGFIAMKLGKTKEKAEDKE